jgi:hypothetical protein
MCVPPAGPSTCRDEHCARDPGAQISVPSYSYRHSKQYLCTAEGEYSLIQNRLNFIENKYFGGFKHKPNEKCCGDEGSPLGLKAAVMRG